MAPEDDLIKADVLAELGCDRRLQPNDLEVSVEDQVARDVLHDVTVRAQAVIAKLTQHIHVGTNPDEDERRKADVPHASRVADLARAR